MDLSIAVRWIIAIAFFAVGFTFWMTYYGFQGHLHNDKMKVRLIPIIILLALVVLMNFGN